MKALSTALLGLAALAMAGCANNHRYTSEDIPHNEFSAPIIDDNYELVGAGKPPMSVVITSSGWVKVLDVTSHELVHTAQLPPDDNGFVVKLDTELKAITYNNVKAEKPIIVLPINPDHRYEIYYRR